jgi:putative ABC transport system permease protein
VTLGTPLRKAVRDLQQERARTLLVALAIALGIAGFGAVLSSYAVLTREMNSAYLATNPASFTIDTDRVDARLLEALVRREGVGAVEARRTLRARIRARPGDWRGLVLFVLPDFRNLRISTLVPQRGAWPPGPGELLIERDAFQVIGASVGDTVTVRTTEGEEATLRVGGSVHDVGQAQARMEQLAYGYATPEALVRLGQEPYLDQLKVVVSGDRNDEARVRRVAADVRHWLEDNGHPVRNVVVPPPGKHPHADIMGLLLLAQSSFGLLALGLSGILVVHLVTALMAAQTRQIGVMKAVGGSEWQIARLYLAQALALGGLAVLLAIPAGAVGGRAISRAMAVFLNFDVRSFAVPAWVYLLEIAVGLAAPLAAAAWPVLRGSAISVRDALADTGVRAPGFGEDALDRALAGVRGLSRPVLLSVRNAFRRRGRMALSLLTLGTAGVFFMSALNVRASMVHTLDRMFEAMRFDVVVAFATPQPLAAIERAAGATAGVERVEGWIATEASLVRPVDSAAATGAEPQAAASVHGAPAAASDRFSVLALPADSSLLELRTREGRGLRGAGGNAIVVNTRLAALEPAFAVGREVTLRMGHGTTTWRVVGQAFEPFAPATAYVSRERLEELAGGHLSGTTNSVRVALSPDARRDALAMTAVKAELEARLAREGLRPASLASKGERRVGFDEHMRMIYVLLVVVSSILGAVGALGLATATSLDVTERRRELGVLRAIGAAPAAIALLLVAESAFVALLGWALAALVAWPTSRLVGNALVHAMLRTGVDFAVEPLGPAVWLAVSLSLAALASVFPAWRAARLSVREALSHE